MKCYNCKLNLTTSIDYEKKICKKCRNLRIFISRTDANIKYHISDNQLNKLFHFDKEYENTWKTFYIEKEVLNHMNSHFEEYFDDISEIDKRRIFNEIE